MAGSILDPNITVVVTADPNTLVQSSTIEIVNSSITDLSVTGNVSLTGHVNLNGVQLMADWASADSSSNNFIKNKPTNVSAFANDAGYLTVAAGGALGRMVLLESRAPRDPRALPGQQAHLGTLVRSAPWGSWA